MASNSPGAGWKRVGITVPRGGRFLRTGDVPSPFGGPKIVRLLPSGWNGQFMRFLRR
jgi:hypothetical protein